MHLLENVTNLRCTQMLMVHSSSEATEIYTHVAQSDILKAPSPLDHLDTEGYI